MRRPISSLTGWLSIVWPRSPCTTPPAHRPKRCEHRHLVVHVDGVERGVDDRRRRRRIAALVAGARIELRGGEQVGDRGGNDDEADEIDEPAEKKGRHGRDAIIADAAPFPGQSRVTSLPQEDS